MSVKVSVPRIRLPKPADWPTECVPYNYDWRPSPPPEKRYKCLNMAAHKVDGRF